MSKATCALCSKGIHKFEELTVLNRSWHKPCFKCGGSSGQGCKQVLTVDSFAEQDGQPFCLTCHIRLFSKGPVFSIPVEDAWVDPNPRPSLVASKIITIDAAKCTACAKNVYKAEEVLAGDRIWHKSCFKCGGTANEGGCGRVLSSDPNTFKDHHSDPYCAPCYARLFADSDRVMTQVKAGVGVVRHTPDNPNAQPNLIPLDAAPTCCVCAKITYKYEQHQALGRVWHKDCFKCNGCKKLLSLTVFAERSDQPYCLLCLRSHFGEQADASAASGETGLRQEAAPPSFSDREVDPWGEPIEENEEFWVDKESRERREQKLQQLRSEAVGAADGGVIPQGILQERAQAFVQGQGKNLVVNERK